MAEKKAEGEKADEVEVKTFTDAKGRERRIVKRKKAAPPVAAKKAAPPAEPDDDQVDEGEAAPKGKRSQLLELGLGVLGGALAVAGVVAISRRSAAVSP